MNFTKSVNGAIRLMVVFLVVCVSATAVLTGYAQDTSFLQVTNLDSSQFPNVTLSFRVNRTQADTEFTGGNVSISENGIPVSEMVVERTDTTPIQLAIVVEYGYTRLFMDEEVRSSLQQIVGALRDGVDVVSVLARSDDLGLQPVISPTTNAQSILDWASTVERRSLTGTRNALHGLRETLTGFEIEANSWETTTAIVYVGGVLERPPGLDIDTLLEEVISVANRQNTPIFVIDADPNNADIDNRMARLGQNTGGAYIELTDNRSATDVLQPVVTALNQRHVEYTARYRSATGAMEHNVTVRTPAGETSARYATSLAPPAITIVQPGTAVEINRLANRNDDGDGNAANDTWSFDVSNQPVVAQVSFPDSVRRQLVNAQLLVNGETRTTVAHPNGVEPLEFLWDITDIREKGSNLRTLSVGVTDELGLTGFSQEIQVSVLVDIPESVVNPVIVNEVVDPCQLELTSTECLTQWALRIAPSAIIGIPLFLIILSQRKRLAGAVVSSVSATTTFVRQTFIRSDASSSKPLATLQVLEGHANGRQDIKMIINDLRLGRLADEADVVVGDVDSENRSISRKHCTVHYDSALHEFTLTDHGSRFGTYVNNERVVGQTTLHDDDVIVLGLMQANGVKLRFSENAHDASNQRARETSVRHNTTREGPVKDRETAVSEDVHRRGRVTNVTRQPDEPVTNGSGRRLPWDRRSRNSGDGNGKDWQDFSS